MSQNKTLLVLLILVMGIQVHADSSKSGSHGSGGGSSGDFWQRSDKREASRWTLQEWLEQRDRSRMMDIWLSLNSASPYEFKLGYWQNSYDTVTSAPASTTGSISTAGNFSAYAQIFGLSLEHENNIKEQYSDLVGKFDLRLLGNSIQNSNLTLHFGQRTRNLTYLASGAQVKNPFAELSLCLHFSKFFGLTGDYRYYQPTTDTTLNQSIAGSLTEGGVFIDFKALRVFGSWFQDLQTNTPTAGAMTTTTRTGYRGGVEIYF